MNRNLFGIFMKYPEPSRVKTRLARDIGNHRAAKIYRQIAEQILYKTETFDADFEMIIFYDPIERLYDFETWIPGNRFMRQEGNDIGIRMDNAIRKLLALGAEKVILTGADIPDLNSEIVASAFQALDHADIVIGPATDGGYYLIGMKKPHGEIFHGIPWSTEKVFDKTLHTIGQLGLSCLCTAVLSDLDTADDYHKYLTRAAHPKPERSP